MSAIETVTTVYLKNKTGKMYKVLKYDRAAKVMRLLSPDGKEFDVPNATKENLTKAGYELVTQ
jgi:hypothetical protein